MLATDVSAVRPTTLPALVEYLSLDVRSDEAWGAALEHVMTSMGGLDLLVNNAGVAAAGRINVATMEEWQWIVHINLLGVVRGCRTFTPLFKSQGRATSSIPHRLPGASTLPGCRPTTPSRPGLWP